MTSITSNTGFLVSSNPDDALLFSVNEHSGQQHSERGHEDCSLSLITGADRPGSGCATTRTIEVLVNGVKQVIIIPSAQSSSDVTAPSSFNLQPPPFSSSSVPDSVPLDRVPDDVKLLAESCVQVTSSVQVKSSIQVTSFAQVTPLSATLSLSRPADINGLSHSSSAGFMNHTAPLPPLHNHLSRMPGFGCSRPPEVPRNVYNNIASAATAPQFHMNSVLPDSNIPAAQNSLPFPTSNTPAAQHLPAFSASNMLQGQSPAFPTNSMLPGQHSPAFPAVVLPRCGFAPSVQQAACTMPLQSPVPQLYPSPAYRSSVMPSQMQPDLMGHLHPGRGSEAPWMSYSTLPMRPAISAYARTVDTVVNSRLPSGHSLAAPQTAPHLPYYMAENYRHFFPWLQSAIDPSASIHQPGQPAAGPFQHFQYMPLTKYGYNAQHVDASIYHMPPQFDAHAQVAAGHGTSGFQQLSAAAICAAPVTASEPRLANARHANLSRKRSRSKHQETATVSQSISQSYSHSSVQPMSQHSASSVIHSGDVFHSLNSYATRGSVACPTTVHSTTGTMMNENPARQFHSSASLSCCQPVNGNATDAAVSVNPTQPTALAVTAIATIPLMSVATDVTQTHYQSAVTQNNNNLMSDKPLTGILTDLPVSTRQVELTTTGAVIAAVTGTTCQPTATAASMCRVLSVATESDSTEHLPLDPLLRDVGHDPSVTSLPSNCSLTSVPSLSNISATDLFGPKQNEEISMPNAKTTVSSGYSSTSSPMLSELLVTSMSTPSCHHSVSSFISAPTLDQGQASDVGLEVPTSQLYPGQPSNKHPEVPASQLDDGSSDLPVDVMVETSESVSLLMSFCNMFEQSNGAAQHEPPQSAAAAPSIVTSAAGGVTSSAESRTNSASCDTAAAQSALQFAKSLGKGRHFAEEVRRQRREQAAAGRKRRRRRTRLTSLEYAEDESNSSDSWHPEGDNQSESDECRSVSSLSATTTSPSATTTSSVTTESALSDETASCVSAESDESAPINRPRRSKRQRVTDASQQRPSHHHHNHRDNYSAARPDYHHHADYTAVGSGQELASVDKSARPQSAITRPCSVLLERLQLRCWRSINVHHLPRFICCPAAAQQQQRYCIKPVQRLASTDSESSTDGHRSLKKLRVKFLRVEDSESS